MSFATTLPEVQASQLALWGDSYSAAEVIVVAAFDALPGPKRWHDIEGGHFGLLYPATDTFERAVAIQGAFLLEVLAAA